MNRIDRQQLKRIIGIMRDFVLPMTLILGVVAYLTYIISLYDICIALAYAVFHVGGYLYAAWEVYKAPVMEESELLEEQEEPEQSEDSYKIHNILLNTKIKIQNHA